MKNKNCEHLNFESLISVGRITNEAGVVENYVAEIKVKCRDCQTPFQFIGMPLGVSYDKPMMEVDGLEARLPIAPQGEIPHPLGKKLRGYEIKKRID